MGRHKIETAKKRVSRSISISQENIDKIAEYDIKNVSKFVDWLLKEHFGKMVENVGINENN